MWNKLVYDRGGLPLHAGCKVIPTASGGKVYATEAGCFAKTFGLNPDDEPTIYGAVTKPAAYLENVSQRPDGELDFFDTSYTQNGRATFSFSAIEAGDARQPECAHFLPILNRNEKIIPA